MDLTAFVKKCAKSKSALAKLSKDSPELALELKRLVEEQYWLSGDLKYLLWPGAQTMMYDFIASWKAKHPDLPGPLYLEILRGGGKSVFEVIYQWQLALKYPGTNHYFFLDTITHGEKVTRDAIQLLMSHKPQSINIHKHDTNQYTITKPGQASSTWTILGIKETSGETQRGLRCHSAVIDEGATLNDFDYIRRDVVGGFFRQRQNPLCLVSTTPPRSMAHPIISAIDDAQLHGRLLRIPGSLDPNFYDNPKEVAKAIATFGSPTSTAYLREIEVQHISDDTALAVPEFNDAKPYITPTTYQRPSLFYPFICGDLGLHDYTAFIFGYIDFNKQVRVIEDEVVVHYKNTKEIADLIINKEFELYGDKLKYGTDPYKTPLYDFIKRWCDNDAQQIHDFRTIYKLYLNPVEKRGNNWKEIALATLRTEVQQHRLIMLPRCKNLIYQLETAVLNEKRNDFERYKESDDKELVMGHADALVAAMYAIQMSQSLMHLNPYPYTPSTVGEWVRDQLHPEDKPTRGTVNIEHNSITINDTRKRR